MPTGVAAFAEGIAIRRYGEQSNNLVHWSDTSTSLNRNSRLPKYAFRPFENVM